MARSLVTQSLRLAAMTATVFGLIACSSKNSNPVSGKEYLNVAAIEASSLPKEKKAEAIAEAGEQLIGTRSFVYANDVFETALKIDPTNRRAQFYHRSLAPSMALKGIATRVRPLLDEKAKLEMEVNLANYPDSGVKRFLTDGREDLKSEKDIQVLIDAYISLSALC